MSNGGSGRGLLPQTMRLVTNSGAQAGQTKPERLPLEAYGADRSLEHPKSQLNHLRDMNYDQTLVSPQAPPSHAARKVNQDRLAALQRIAK